MTVIKKSSEFLKIIVKIINVNNMQKTVKQKAIAKLRNILYI